VKGNLLANPSFDSGSFEGWNLVQTSGPYTWDPANTRVPFGREAGGSGYALKVTLLPNSPFRLRSEVYVPVNAGKDYHLGIYAKGGSSNTTLRLGVRYLSTGWSFLETHYTEVVLNTTTYQLIQFSSTPPPEAAYANFGIWVNNTGTTNVDVFFDDVFMYEVDYPVMNALFNWSNTFGSYTLLPQNYFRLYAFVAKNEGTSAVTVVIHENIGAIYDTSRVYNISYIYCSTYLPASGSFTTTFNPPIYSAVLPGATIRITATNATGGLVTARVLFNGAPNRSVAPGTI
jgi:hypothetical protein